MNIVAERIVKTEKAAKYNHLTASPDRSGEVGFVRCIDCRSRGPTVSGRIVPPACLKKAVLLVIVPSPHNHLIACPYSCVSASPSRRIKTARSSPAVRARVVPRSRVYMHTAVGTAPDDHRMSRPYGAVPR